MSKETEKETVTTADTVEETTKTHEYVIIDGTSYQTESVSTGDGQISDRLKFFSRSGDLQPCQCKADLSVSGEDLKPYGVYSNLTFTSATVDADGLVTVVFHIAQPAELRLAALERSQAEQDDAIAELLGGEE